MRFKGVGMKSRLNLRAGQKGTKKLVERFGDSLLYVRYRYDEKRGVRLKTVELVIEEIPWQPAVKIKDTDIVPVAVGYSENDLRQQLKDAGGIWNPEAKLWYVSYGAIKGTELEKRIPETHLKTKPQKVSHTR